MRRFAALLLFSWGCGSAPTLADVDPALFTYEPTYTRDVAPFMDRYCVACHDRAGLLAGGVELQNYDAVYASRIKNVCTAVTPEVIERFGDSLRSIRQPPDEPPCLDWEPASMPTGAKIPMTLREQVIFARWVEIGAPQ